LTEIINDSRSERAVARSLIAADFRAKVADAKRTTPRHELGARLAALRMEYLATLTAVSMKISQQARERRRVTRNMIAARQKQQRLAASLWVAAKEIGSRWRGSEPSRPRWRDRGSTLQPQH
jgi:hypothetical protein